MKPPFELPESITQSWLKKLAPDVLQALYQYLERTDDYLSYGSSTRPSNNYLKVRNEMVRRGYIG